MILSALNIPIGIIIIMKKKEKEKRINSVAFQEENI